jgi:hypothetical protein
VNGSAAIEDSFDTPIENVFPDAGEAPQRPTQAEPAAYSEWAGVGSGGREDSDYNLEAFVSAERTLGDHLAEQLSLAIADPVHRIIGQHLIDSVDEAGYLTADLAPSPKKLAPPTRRGRGRCSRSCRARALRLAARRPHQCLAIQPRSSTASIRHAGVWSSITTCWPSAILAPSAVVRRGRRRPRRHDPRDPRAHPKPGLASARPWCSPRARRVS